MPRLFVVTAAAAVAAIALPAAAIAKPVAAPNNEIGHVEYPGMQKIRYRYGPITINPGQNVIRINASDLHPKVPGFITRFEPNLVRVKDNSVPRVDILHLHHAVWLVNGYPTFAAGEEKTVIQAPRGFGWKVNGNENWAVNDMLHNLIPTPDRVYLTWDIDFVPLSTPAGQAMKGTRTQWMDVAGLASYPVFDARRGMGTKGRYTFPDQATGAERNKIGFAKEWRVPHDVTIVQTAGHLHPGGLWTDLTVTRNGVTKRLFRSRAKYFEPAGAVSWDVAMYGTPANWRVRLKAGDLVKVSATYDTSKASWYESMGIMPLAVHDGSDGGGVDPFVSPVPQQGVLTHGHLPENDNHGGGPGGLPDARKLLSGSAVGGNLKISDFVYTRGDLSLTGRAGRPPVVRQGGSITFENLDATIQTPNETSEYHTITACRAPCSAQTGIAYPLANGPRDFDSGELGYGPAGFTAASNRNTWATPKTLAPGTYTYFCRIHPFMRGAFRVVKSKTSKRA